MLTLFSKNSHPNCDGIGRRDFLKIGGLGLGGFGLPQLLAARASGKERQVGQRHFGRLALAWWWPDTCRDI